MGKDTTYNGWINYETWAVNLWLTSCEDTEKKLNEIANKAPFQLKPHQQADKLQDMVHGLMDDFIDNLYEFGGSIPRDQMFIDLIRGAINNVKWDAIIDHHTDFD